MHFLDIYLLRLHMYCTIFYSKQVKFCGRCSKVSVFICEDFPSGIPLHELSHALLIIIA